MFAETARRIFDILGKDDTPRGVITADQVPDALARLTAAVDAEKEALRAAQKQSDEAERRGDEAAAARAVSLGQRAFPLIEMLRAAQKKKVDVTWGV
jgi:hypothetical protein